MRRKDRELNNYDEICEILKLGKIAQIAFIDNNEPYIVTLNYGFMYQDEKLKLYFHSAKDGKKIDCIRSNPNVCFTIAICDPFVVGEKACNYGMKYRSVVGYGLMRLVEKSDERQLGLDLLMKQYTGKDAWDYDNEMLLKTAVMCIEVTKITGKRKQ